MTAVLTAVTALAWLLVYAIGREEWAAIWGGFIPVRFGLPDDGTVAPFWLTPLTATLVHGGLVHLGFNLLILVFCGRSVEGVLGPVNQLILYVVGAYGAAAVHWLVAPAEAVPMVGASGAISAILGAYAMLFGRNKVKVADPRLALWLNALWLIVAFVALQFLIGRTFSNGVMSIAFGAHIGGFLVGIALANPLLLLRYRRA